MRSTLFSYALLLAAIPCQAAFAQAEPPVGPDAPHVDAILEHPDHDPAADPNNDGTADSPDLGNDGDNKTASASFETGLSIAYASADVATTVTLPITFSKPVQGTIAFDLGGSALATGDQRDVSLTQKEISLDTPTDATAISITIEPWRGFGGEKILRISLKSDPNVITTNGEFPSHILRLRQFDAGEFTGMLNFPASSGLPALPVRIGLKSDGTAFCSFQNPTALLGEKLEFEWTQGLRDFPNLTGSPETKIPGETFRREEDLTAKMTIERMATPYPEEIDALLEGFPADGQPAVYHANLVLPDLFAAEPSITYEGRLIINPVNYPPDAP